MTDAQKPVWFIFFVIIGLIAVVGASKLFAPKEIVPWRDNFTAARQEAAETGKPIFAYFTADWCAPCQRMKRTTWADEQVEAALRQYVPTRIDFDRNEDLAISYRVRVLPVMAVMDAEGKVLRSTDLPMTPEQFLKWLNG